MKNKMKCEKVSWTVLTKIEPRLIILLHDTKAIKDRGEVSFCANRIWFDIFDERLYKLVGWEARNLDPRIRTSEAYDLVFNKVYEVLPPCRNCLCFGGDAWKRMMGIGE